MNDDNDILEIPEATCPGCDGRDRIIRSLATEIDRRDGIEPAIAQEMYNRRAQEHNER